MIELIFVAVCSKQMSLDRQFAHDSGIKIIGAVMEWLVSGAGWQRTDGRVFCQRPLAGTLQWPRLSRGSIMTNHARIILLSGAAAPYVADVSQRDPDSLARRTPHNHSGSALQILTPS